MARWRILAFSFCFDFWLAKEGWSFCSVTVQFSGLKQGL